MIRNITEEQERKLLETFFKFRNESEKLCDNIEASGKHHNGYPNKEALAYELNEWQIEIDNLNKNFEMFAKSVKEVL